MKRVFLYLALVCVLLAGITIIQKDALAIHLTWLSFMQIPLFSGGEINRSYLSNGLHITVNEPVFKRWRQQGEGFVQLRFSPIRSMPDTIRESIDYNADGRDDFRILLLPQSGKTEIQPENPAIQGVSVSTALKTDWVIRVNLKQPRI